MKRIAWVIASLVLAALGGGCIGPAPAGNAGTCGSVAACYSMTVSLDPTSPPSCASMGTTMATAVADYTNLAADGPFSNASCTGNLSACTAAMMCSDARIELDFTASGFSGTIVQGGCKADVSGSRLTACPVPGADGGSE